jgi:DNA polymerase delta subunit 1
LAFVRCEVQNLLRGKIAFDELLLSKQLRDNYKSDNLPHLKVAEKMRGRDPASAPRSGDRVPFVYVEPKDPKLRLACDFAEDPIYAKTKSLLPHSVYYLDNQLHNPIVSLFELIVPDVEKRIFGDPVVKVLRNQCVNRAKRQRTIASFFGKT